MIHYIFFVWKKNEPEKRFLYLDVTYLSKCERFAGICRVVAKLQEFLPLIQSQYEVIPVIGKQFLGFYKLSDGSCICPSSNDIFLSAEVTQGIIDTNALFFSRLKKKNCRVCFFLHDLIPVLYPDFNGSPKFFRYYKKYLRQLAKADRVVCNSNSVLSDFNKYIEENKIKTASELKKSYTHLGVDFKPAQNGVSGKIKLPAKVNFLMVSTVEVRKMYDQAVEAFSILWEKDLDVSLSIVGKYGWRAERARNLIENSPYKDKKLFWYNQGISDAELAELYQSCDAVIFASMTEGFGLALIEAAIYKKPLIIRDIPIFREVAGENAFYFSGTTGEELAVKIREWLELYDNGTYPCSDKISYISWEQSVKNVFAAIAES
ncbi:MAG: glycosyltransferase family 4 protein [Treponema sp.]|nr:glycosyltransferase family 4 protein [Treponema sp.]